MRSTLAETRLIIRVESLRRASSCHRSMFLFIWRLFFLIPNSVPRVIMKEIITFLDYFHEFFS